MVAALMGTERAQKGLDCTLGNTPQARSKWPNSPNLRLRPHSPAKGRGRVQRQVRRAFVVNGPVVSSSTVYDWTHARLRQGLGCGYRWAVRRILREIAERVGRAGTIGRPWLWRLRD
jgi:hypothetical protein